MNDYKQMLKDQAERLGISEEEAFNLAVTCLSFASDSQLRLYNTNFKVTPKEYLVRATPVRDISAAKDNDWE
jgi:hypothetical protein